MTVSVVRLERILAVLDTYGYGITIRHVHKGQRSSGLGSDETYAADGWEIGWLNSNGGDELALDPDLNTALKLALDATSHWDDD